MKKKILIIAGYYLPGVKAGGPIQSIKNLVENLKDDCDFYILANDRDLGDKESFQNIEVDKWNKVDEVNVFYTNVSKLSFQKLLMILKSKDFELLYLNSFFSFKLSIVPYLLTKLKLAKFKRIIIATRGNFAGSALNQKKGKKKIYLIISKILRLYKEVVWHATNDIEKDMIECQLYSDAEVIIANNLTSNYSQYLHDKYINKSSGELKIVYIARIHPIKNLLQTLKILHVVKGKIEFNIYGPIEDKDYWNKCLGEIDRLKNNIQVNYLGQVSNDKVVDIYREHHVAILMTLGENFGHSIAEALIGGCPVIISDRTPWRNLMKYNAGYDISLDNETEFISAISEYVEMDSNNYSMNSKKAFEYAKSISNNKDSINAYLQMFDIRNHN